MNYIRNHTTQKNRFNQNKKYKKKIYTEELLCKPFESLNDKKNGLPSK